MFCRFSTAPDGAIVGAAYDVAAAYRAADSVVVAHVDRSRRKAGQPLAVSRVVKAPDAAPLTYVGQPASERPVFEGLRLPSDREFVLLLRAKSNNRYSPVDGDGAGCPTIFPVKDGYARVGSQAVAVDNLEKFFDAGPDAIAFP